jgi:hypothetical protein
MKTLLSLTTLLILATAAPVFAQSKDTELKVGRRTLDRQDKIARPRKDREELTRGLHITVKNIGTKPLAEGEVEWSILVMRPGNQRSLLSTGTEKLKALQTSEVASFDVGAVPVQEQGNNQQDMEYRVVVRRAGAEAAVSESTPSFEQQAQSARGAEKGARKKK